ncbi:MAG: hypothetical protein S0880_09025 [Actinomycetota bacterium]|nr:hypothetical protein [Actinomycetota bacterium]
MERGGEQPHVVELETLGGPEPAAVDAPEPPTPPDEPPSSEERRVGRVLVALTAVVSISLLAGVDYGRLLGGDPSPTSTTVAEETGPGTEEPPVTPGEPVDADSGTAPVPSPVELALEPSGDVVTLAVTDDGVTLDVPGPAGAEPGAVVDLVVRGAESVVLDADGVVTVHPSGRALGEADEILAGGSAGEVWLLDAGTTGAATARLVDLDGERAGPTVRLGVGARALGATADGLVVRNGDEASVVEPSGTTRVVPEPASLVAVSRDHTLRGSCTDSGCELWLSGPVPDLTDSDGETDGRSVPVPAEVVGLWGAGASISPTGEQLSLPVEVHDPGRRRGHRTALLAVDLSDGRSVVVDVPLAGDPDGGRADAGGVGGGDGPTTPGDGVVEEASVRGPTSWVTGSLAAEPGQGGAAAPIASSWSVDGDWLFWTGGTKLWAGRPGLTGTVELAADLDPLHALALGAAP